MRLIRFTYVVGLALLAAACESKNPPADTDTAPDTGGGSSGEPSGTSGSTTTGPDPTGAPPQTSSDSSSTTTTTAGTETSPDEPVDPPPTIEPTPCEGEAVPIEASALAILVVPTGPSCGEGGTECWDGPPADSLDVQFTSVPRVCGEDVDVSACGTWRLRFNIPPELQAPGLYHLTGPTIYGYAGVTEPGDGQCATQSEFLHATLEIVAVDDTGVRGRLCHVESQMFADAGAQVEGSFFAQRCE